MTTIIKNLILGDSCDGTKVENFIYENIKTIINCTNKDYSKGDINIYSNYEYMFLNIMDYPNENIKKYFESTFNFIEKNIKKGAVLIFCGGKYLFL